LWYFALNFFSSLLIVAAFNLKTHCPIAMKGDNIFYIDNNQEDLQLCATLVDDIDKNLREAEVIDSC
jgi:hypothetical protein